MNGVRPLSCTGELEEARRSEACTIGGSDPVRAGGASRECVARQADSPAPRPLRGDELRELAARVERAELLEAADRLLADHDLRDGVPARQVHQRLPEVRLRLDVDVVELDAARL